MPPPQPVGMAWDRGQGHSQLGLDSPLAHTESTGLRQPRAWESKELGQKVDPTPTVETDTICSPAGDWTGWIQDY